MKARGTVLLMLLSGATFACTTSGKGNADSQLTTDTQETDSTDPQSTDDFDVLDTGVEREDEPQDTAEEEEPEETDETEPPEDTEPPPANVDYNGTYVDNNGKLFYYPDAAVLSQAFGSVLGLPLPNRMRCNASYYTLEVDDTAPTHVTGSLSCTGWQAVGGNLITNPLLEELLFSDYDLGSPMSVSISLWFSANNPARATGTATLTGGADTAGSANVVAIFNSTGVDLTIDNTDPILGVGVEGTLDLNAL